MLYPYAIYYWFRYSRNNHNVSIISKGFFNFIFSPLRISERAHVQSNSSAAQTKPDQLKSINISMSKKQCHCQFTHALKKR